jgi:predicted membrane chloride channel (bestrophin family)
VMVALIVFMFTFPLQMCEVINDDFAAPVVSFLGVCVVVVVNRVATELEEPFMDDANDLPLADLHVDFNEKLNKLVAPRFWRTRWSHKSADGDERAHIIPLPELK